MIKDWRESHVFRGGDLKRGAENNISDMDVYKKARTNPQKYMLDDGYRPNFFRVRADLVEERQVSVSRGDSWMQEMIRMYEDMSGLSATDANFWQEPGFKEAVKKGFSIQLRRMIDDQGWVWIIVRAMETDWMFKRRVGELDRQEAIRRQKLKSMDRKW